MKEKKALYRKIYDDILEKVRTSQYKAGDRIPTEKELAERYGVSRITSKKAMDLAAENRIITRTPGKGSFITKDAIRLSSRQDKGDMKTIAVIQPDLSEFFGLEFYKEIESLAFEDGIFLVNGLSSKDMNKEKELIRRFHDYGADGFLILPVHYETFNNEILRLILEKFPLVLIDRSLREIACASVVSQNYEGGKRGIQYLCDLGHRNIGIVSRPMEAGSSLQDRERGVIDGLMENSLTLESGRRLTELDNLDDQRDETYDKHLNKVCAFLEENRDLTALFTLEYSPVTLITRAARKLGLRIPEDLSVLSFDSPGHLVDRVKPVSHVKQDEKTIARRAYAMLRTMMNGEIPEEYRQLIGTKIIRGETTAPPRES